MVVWVQKNFLFCVIMVSKVVLLLSAVLFCDAGVVDSLGKCSIKDLDCHKEMFRVAIETYAPIGVPEYDIPVIDPYEIKDTSVSVLGLVDITMVDGLFEGLKTVQFENYETNIEEGYSVFDVYFDVLTISGRYTAVSSPIVLQVIGSNVTADGEGKMVMDQVKINFKFPFSVKKLDDGEIYIVPDTENITYNFNVLGGIKFEANNIKYGIIDISRIVTGFMNRNWQYVLNNFSRIFTDRAVALHSVYMTRFFTTVPAKEYMTDDLTPYLKN